MDFVDPEQFAAAAAGVGGDCCSVVVDGYDYYCYRSDDDEDDEGGDDGDYDDGCSVDYVNLERMKDFSLVVYHFETGDCCVIELVIHLASVNY